PSPTQIVRGPAQRKAIHRETDSRHALHHLLIAERRGIEVLGAVGAHAESRSAPVLRVGGGGAELAIEPLVHARVAIEILYVGGVALEVGAHREAPVLADVL